MCRLNYLEEKGLKVSFMQKHGFGPVILREEARFLKEIRLHDMVTIDLKLASSRRDFSRWTIRHEIKKGETVAAIITVDGAWLDIKERKLHMPPQEAKDVFDSIDHEAGFEWTD
jgi:acyl-CoA thioester hydrolase